MTLMCVSFCQMANSRLMPLITCLTESLLKAKGNATTPPPPPPSATTTTLHTWTGKMTSQWQSQLASHPTPQHTQDTGKKRGRGQLVHLTHNRTSRVQLESRLQLKSWNHSQEVTRKNTWLVSSSKMFKFLFATQTQTQTSRLGCWAI